jgi:hypothetical protein
MTNILEKLEFYSEEVILGKKTQPLDGITSEVNPFETSSTPSESNALKFFQVLKVGALQTVVKVGDTVLVRGDAMTKEINIDGLGTIKDTYLLQSHKMIACKLC